jgi:hypothetical protein
MVFCVAYATIRAPDDTVICEGWCWHTGTEFVQGDELNGPFKSERVAQKDALANCQMMN